ncbi:MAG: hypothetical protein IJK23_09680 [Clostridia bacterium]|nr:hypothetical protein [Clostridia bacterium]
MEYGINLEPMKIFSVIDSQPDAIRRNGYTLDFETDRTHHTNANDYAQMMSDDGSDDFYDLDGAKLCEDVNGDLYAVQYGFPAYGTGYDPNIMVPLIYQKVRKA